MGNIAYDPTMIGGGGGSYGMFGGGGGSIVEGLILGAVLGDGFGGRKNDDTCGQFAAVNQNITNGAYALSSEIALGNQFTNTNLQAGFNGITTQNAQETDLITSQICASNNDLSNRISDVGYQSAINTLNTKFELSQAIAGTAAQAAACCCEIKTQALENKYQAELANEARYNALSKQGTCETQSILSKLCSMELNTAQDTIAELRAERNNTHVAGAITTIINQLGVGNRAPVKA